MYGVGIRSILKPRKNYLGEFTVLLFCEISVNTRNVMRENFLKAEVRFLISHISSLFTPDPYAVITFISSQALNLIVKVKLT